MADKLYIASRVFPQYVEIWKRLRDVEGWPIVCTWIDEAGPFETKSYSELWTRIEREVSSCDRLLFYAKPGDFPFKGALIEVGMAIALGKKITVCLPRVELQGLTLRPVGSWIKHPSVTRIDQLEWALLGLEDGPEVLEAEENK